MRHAGEKIVDSSGTGVRKFTGNTQPFSNNKV